MAGMVDVSESLDDCEVRIVKEILGRCLKGDSRVAEEEEEEEDGKSAKSRFDEVHGGLLNGCQRLLEVMLEKSILRGEKEKCKGEEGERDGGNAKSQTVRLGV